MTVPFRAAFAAIAVSASVAAAQPFLEFTVMTEGEMFGLRHEACASFVVDASDPAQTIIPSTLAGHSPSFESGPVVAPLNFSSSQFGLDGGELTIQYSGASPGSSTSVFMRLQGGPPTDPDGSIPDDPAAYSTWSQGTCTANSLGVNLFIIWNTVGGFDLGDDGRFFVSVREVPDPNPPMPDGCSEADLAEPYGVLDFSDVVAFLSAFSVGCP